MRNLNAAFPTSYSTTSLIVIALVATIFSTAAVAQSNSVDAQPTPVASMPAPAPTPPQSKRIFGIVPNYRSTPEMKEYKPATTHEKFVIASQDSFDRGTFALAAIFAGESQLSDANHSYGQGGKGYGKYLAASYADFAIGDYLTEAIFPTFLHQDPRYFSRLRGSGLSRLGYSLSRIIITKSDSGKPQFNYSEVLGNATAAGISNFYYRDNRTAGANIGKLGTQLAVDAASNVLKEFWPDVSRKFARKHANSIEPAPVK